MVWQPEDPPVMSLFTLAKPKTVISLAAMAAAAGFPAAPPPYFSSSSDGRPLFFLFFPSYGQKKTMVALAAIPAARPSFPGRKPGWIMGGWM